MPPPVGRQATRDLGDGGHVDDGSASREAARAADGKFGHQPRDCIGATYEDVDTLHRSQSVVWREEDYRAGRLKRPK